MGRQLVGLYRYAAFPAERSLGKCPLCHRFRSRHLWHSSNLFIKTFGMKNLLTVFALIGILILAYGPPPMEKALAPPSGIVLASDRGIQADVIYAVDEPALSAAGATGPVKWVDENFWQTVSGILFVIYEFLALKIPTSRSVSVIGNLYKLLTWFVPDKSKQGGQFSIRDKL